MVNGNLPDGWELVNIGDVADTTSGGTPSRKYSEYFEGTIPWVKSGELGDGLVSVTEEKITETAIKNSSAKIFPAGSVLVALYGATVGKVGILNMDAASNQAVCALFPKNNSFIAKYMFYWLMSQRHDLINKSVGGAQPNISQGIVRAHPFPLSPLPEQVRIVNRIEELLSDLDAGVAALERVRAGLKRYKVSVLKVACEGRLFESERVESNELPDGWQWTTLGQSFKVERGRFSIRPRNDPRYYTGKYPFVQIGDLPRDGGNIVSYSQTLNDDGLKVSKIFRKGTVLIAIVGATIANTGILTFDSCCPDSLVAIQSDDETQLRFVEMYLQSKKMEIRQSAYASGGQPNINLQTLAPYPIPLPPLDEQRRIVAEVERRLSVVGEVESAVEAGLVRAARLRQSVLRSAFEGRLT